MRSIIIGTAGHIDHGKTALVKALTGIDADRLEEEKRRGITIDLGFAHMELQSPVGGTLRFGFVDVPGHERFVRNMLAGVGGIDVVLLVIAADEGIKPQTREHFDICRLLSIQHGVTVLTKSDLVDSDTVSVLRLEVEDFLRGSFLEQAPIIPASSLKGTGLDELKRALADLASKTEVRDSSAITRLPIDRVFTMKGFGTIVTGTLVAGGIRREDEMELFPAKQKVRIRGVQVHGSAADRAVAGERTALNLAGVEKAELARGMMLASSGLLETSSRVDVKLSLLTSAKALKTGTRVHLHAFSAETVASIRLYENQPIRPGGDAFAQLRLSEPLLLLPGDRFVVRQFSPVVTIGGGVVLDAFPMKKQPGLAVNFFRELASGDPARILKARVARRAEQGLTVAQATAETGWRKEKIAEHAANSQEILRISDVLIARSALEQLRSRIVAAVQNFHQKNPLTKGIPAESLRERVQAETALFDATLAGLIEEKKLAVSGGLIHLVGRGVVMKDDEAESRQMIEQTFASAGLKVPALREVLAGLKIDKTRAQQIVTLLLREKILIKVADDMVFHQTALHDLRQKLRAEKLKSPKINVAGFKDLTGISRKYAIPLLEYLDRERVTRRAGDERIIL